MDDMRIAELTMIEAYEYGGLAEQLLKMRKYLLEERGLGFAGQTFFIEDDVDYMWHLRILAYRGILVETPSKADFVVYSSDATKNDSEDEHINEVRHSKENTVAKKRNPKKVSTNWIEDVIKGF